MESMYVYVLCVKVLSSMFAYLLFCYFVIEKQRTKVCKHCEKQIYNKGKFAFKGILVVVYMNLFSSKNFLSIFLLCCNSFKGCFNFYFMTDNLSTDKTFVFFFLFFLPLVLSMPWQVASLVFKICIVFSSQPLHGKFGRFTGIVSNFSCMYLCQ